mgnify:CR=1 FL=1
MLPPGGANRRLLLDSPPMDLSKHLEKAEDAIRRKNFDYGIDLYRQLLSVSPAITTRGSASTAPTCESRNRKPHPCGSRRSRGPALAMAKTFAAARNFVKEAEALEGYLALDPSNVGVSSSRVTRSSAPISSMERLRCTRGSPRRPPPPRRHGSAPARSSPRKGRSPARSIATRRRSRSIRETRIRSRRGRIWRPKGHC